MKCETFKNTIIGLLIVAAIALSFGGCKNNETVFSYSSGVTEPKKVQFDFTVIHKDGTQKQFAVTTQKETVGEALQNVGIIAGEEGAYGLFVKCVDGETLDYSKDGFWWAFYVDEKQSPTGVDKTPIEKNKTYSFKAEKS